MASRRISAENFVKSPCRLACPAGVDAARYIREIKAGRFDQALAVIRERVPFPTVCADACFSPCEDACAARQFGDPIAIRALKRAAVDRGGDGWKKRQRTPEKTGRRVAVVGAGPAGLTAAYYLAGLGHEVVVYDSFPEPGGTLRYGLPDFRLPKDRLARDIQVILDRGVKFQGGLAVGRDLEFERLRADHDAVFIACGAAAQVDLALPGADLPGVLRGWDLLKNLALGQKYRFSGEVAVVGGGNVAIDAARTARRLGAGNVTIVYRRTRSEMPAHRSEIAAAEAEGITIIDSWAPRRILGQGQVSGLAVVRCATAAGDQYRGREPVIDESITHRISAQTIILAVGQRADLSFLGDRIRREADGRLSVDPASLAASAQGVFGGGDAASGPSSIIEAVAHGRRAAEAIDRHLGGAGDISEKLAEDESGVCLEPLPAVLGRRQEPGTIRAWRRVGSFERVETGLTDRQAAAEAARCLACDARRFEVLVNPDHCKECGYCAEVCRLGVFAKSESFNARGYRPMRCLSPDACVGCLKCFYACPDFAIDVVEASA